MIVLQNATNLCLSFLTQESVGFIFSISSVGSLLGAILYQYALKDYAFRDVLF